MVSLNVNFTSNFNILEYPFVCYNYFHGRRWIEGIGIKKSDIFSNPTLIELSTIKKEIEALDMTRRGELIFI